MTRQDTRNNNQAAAAFENAAVCLIPSLNDLYAQCLYFSAMSLKTNRNQMKTKMAQNPKIGFVFAKMLFSGMEDVLLTC
jgi:hypothetical protein